MFIKHACTFHNAFDLVPHLLSEMAELTEFGRGVIICLDSEREIEAKLVTQRAQYMTQ